MDLATVDHLLTTTRSVRKRLDFSRPVEPAVVMKCIELLSRVAVRWCYGTFMVRKPQIESQNS